MESMVGVEKNHSVLTPQQLFLNALHAPHVELLRYGCSAICELPQKLHALQVGALVRPMQRDLMPLPRKIHRPNRQAPAIPGDDDGGGERGDLPGSSE